MNVLLAVLLVLVLVDLAVVSLERRRAEARWRRLESILWQLLEDSAERSRSQWEDQ